MSDSSQPPRSTQGFASGQGGGSPPTGIVTFLFTDIEGSTRLLQQLGESYADVLAQQRKLLRAAFNERGGHEIDTAGDGLFVAFHRATQAVEAAIEAQRAIASHSWPENAPVRVRMGLHTGEAVLTSEGYIGLDVHRAARICSAGHGGQILLSQTMRDLVENDLLEGMSLRNLGEHRLKDLQHPEQVSQLVTSDLPADFPSLKSLDTLPNNLPLQLTSFIGREKEIAEVNQLFTNTRLLTLTGSGGCGKTRLGLQVVADLLEEFPDGVWVVELAPLSDPSLVTQEVASTLGIREESDELLTGSPLIGGRSPGVISHPSGVDSLLNRLTDYLKSKQILLFLDNCEHLIEACIKLVDVLLHSCPNLKILVASREALGIAGESTYRVPSLSLPDPKNLPPVEEGLVSALNTFESVRLFTDRVLAGVSTFTVTDDNAPAVAQICYRLDGIPLAIELAAARVKVLSVEQITKRLGDRFRLLTGGSRTALPRQQTLRATIDWSYNQLEKKERVLFNRTSVFMGGWTLEAVETICSNERIEEYEVLDTLTSLVEKSLLVAEERKGEQRYILLETVRQYGRDKLLESGEAEGLRDRHLEWYLSLAERAQPELRGPDQGVWLDRLELEQDNMRMALEWSFTEEGNLETGLRLADALLRFWIARGVVYLGEWDRWFERALEKSRDESASVRAKVLLFGGRGITIFQEDYERAEPLLEGSLTLYRELGDKKGIADSLKWLGFLAQKGQSDYERGAALLEESLALYREMGNEEDISGTLGLLAGVALKLGDFGRAAALWDERLALAREVGDKRGVATSLTGLGMVVLVQGDYDRAEALSKESLSLARELRDKKTTAGSLQYLGIIAAYYREDFGRAAALLEQSLSLRRELGKKWAIPILLNCLGFVALSQGNYGRAEMSYKESLSQYQEKRDERGIGLSLKGLAFVAGAQGEVERGARLFGAAEALREAPGFPLPPYDHPEYDRREAAVRAEMGEKAFEVAWAEGRKMSLEEAVALALKEGGTDG